MWHTEVCMKLNRIHLQVILRTTKEKEEFSPAMKAHTTRMANIRKEIISYEARTRPRRKKCDQQLDRDLFKKECIAIAYSLVRRRTQNPTQGTSGDKREIIFFM